MRYENNWYTTTDRSLEIEFLLLEISPSVGWRAYILSDIDYNRVSGERSSLCADTHRLYESDNQRYIDPDVSYPYVCWTQTIRSLDTMRTIAAVWSEITAYYIKHGGSFSAIQKKLADEGVI